MIADINESKTLTKHLSCECKCEFDINVTQINGVIIIKCQCECKKIRVCEKDYIWNLVTRICENGKLLLLIINIMDDSAITCDEVLKSSDDKIKLFQQMLMKRK